MENVLLVTLDTTRADRLGCYGYNKDTSPNLDALAAEGVLFTAAIAQAAVTNTSHASILTGRNPFNHRVRFLLDSRLSALPDSEVTLAEILRREGWYTGAAVSAVPASSRFGLAQGFDHFDEAFEQADGSQRPGDRTLVAADDFLTTAKEPFFMWTHFFDPHDPKIVPPLEIPRRAQQLAGR